MSKLKNVSLKKRVITAILCNTVAIVSLYFAKVYSNVKSTRLVLINEYQTLSE